MDEKNRQKNFIDQVKGKKKVQKKSIGVYKYLVHHSFFEVLTNAYPEFYRIIKEKKLEKEFDKSIYKFMQTKAISPYIWKMPNEYRKFLKKSKYFKKLTYLNDLLHFEYSELFIFMQKSSVVKKKKFTSSKSYRVAKNIILHKYKYDVINKSFDTKQTLYLLGYFDLDLQEVVYRPLNKILFVFLKSIDTTQTLKKNIKLFLYKNKLSTKVYTKEFENVLEELYEKRVLI
ncbi:MAG: hypothetical protein WA945_00325 [Arcobacteraceae bacterium]